MASTLDGEFTAASRCLHVEAQRDLDVKEAECAAVVAGQKAQANRAYDIQSNNIMQQKQIEERTKISLVRKQELMVRQAEKDAALIPARTLNVLASDHH